MKAKFINEVFEKKDDELQKRELLYPALKTVKDPGTLLLALKRGLPRNAVPDKLVSEIIDMDTLKFKYYLAALVNEFYPIYKEKFHNNLKELIKETKNLGELIDISQYITVTDQDITDVINRSDEKSQWSLTACDFSEDPCTWIEYEKEYTLKEIIDNSEELILEFIEKEGITEVPVSLINVDLAFTSDRDFIQFETILSRKYKTKDSDLAWRKWIKQYFPKVETISKFKIK